MAINSIDLAWISVTNMKRARAFFVDKLGLTIMQDTPEYGWMELMGKDGGCALGVGAESGNTDLKPGHNAIVTFSVDNIEKTKAELASKGVTIVGDIIEVPGHIKMLFIKDEDGNFFQVCQPLPQEQHSHGCC
jgi:predicted enzyme related to lactoylglutathione lyase